MYIAICDDDASTLKIIEAKARTLFYEQGITADITCMQNPEHLFTPKAAPFDVIFLDVDMGRWNGIEVAKQIRQYDETVLIVYISAHIKYSPSGYKVNAFRYILKSDLDTTLAECIADIAAHFSTQPETLPVKYGAECVHIKLDDIVYIESQRALVLYKVCNNKKSIYQCYGSIKALDEKLCGKGFLRIQKSFIVNMRYVSRIANYTVYMSTGDELSTTRKGFQALQNAFLLWKGRSH